MPARTWWLATLVVGLLAAGACLPLIDNPNNVPQVGVTLGVAFTSPTTSRSVPQGTVVQIRWSATNTTGKNAVLRILVEARPGLARTTLLDNVPITGSVVSDTLSWDTSGLPAAEYRIIGEITDGERTRDSTAAGVITLNGPPTFVFTGPTSDTTFERGEDLQILFRFGDPEGVGSVRFGLDPDTDHANANEIFIGSSQIPEEEADSSFAFNGQNEDQQDVAEGTYNLFAIVDDTVNPIQTVDGLARIIIPDPDNANNNNSNNNNSNDNTVSLGIRQPANNAEFLSSRPSLQIEFGVNEPADVLIDLKIDPDDNHANGNEIAILSQRLISAGEDTDTFDWNGNDASGAAVPDGIYTLLIQVNRGSGTPETRAGGSFVFRRSVGTLPLSRQNWERTAGPWALTVPTDSPSARRDFGFAFDADRNLTVLYGGRDAAGNNSAETWEWNRVNWTKRDVTGPPALDGLALAFDSQRDVTVLFGGREAGNPRDQTWEFDGDTWTQRGGSGPSARFEHAMAYDSLRGVTVLFGGTDGVIRNGETWEWDGTTWQQRIATGPSDRQGHAMAYDPDRRVVLLFGGSDAFGRTNETWEWDGTAWTQRNPDPVPLPRSDHAMAFDSNRGVIVLFGGRTNEGLSDETWEWDGDAWTLADPTTRPPAREGHGVAFAANAAHTVLFGGVSTIPLIALIEPATIQNVDAGEFVQIRWRDDDPSGGATIRLTLDDDRNPAEGAETGGAEIEILSARSAAADGVSDSFAFQVPASLDPGTYFLFAYIDSDSAAPADQVSTAPGRIIVADPANP